VQDVNSRLYQINIYCYYVNSDPIYLRGYCYVKVYMHIYKI